MSTPSSSALSQYRFRTPFWESQANPAESIDIGGVRPVAVLADGAAQENFLVFRRVSASNPLICAILEGRPLNISVVTSQWDKQGIPASVIKTVLPDVWNDIQQPEQTSGLLPFDDLMDFLVWLGSDGLEKGMVATLKSEKGIQLSFSFRDFEANEVSRIVMANHGAQHPVTEAEMLLIPVLHGWTLDAYTFTVEQVQAALAYDMSGYIDFPISSTESYRIESVMKVVGDSPLLLCWLWISAEVSRLRGGKWMKKKALDAVTYGFIEPLDHLNPRLVLDYLKSGVTDAEIILACLEHGVEPDLATAMIKTGL